MAFFWMCDVVYIEFRVLPSAPLRFLKGRLGSPSWICLGVGIASLTFGIRHTNRHTMTQKGLSSERPHADQVVNF